MDRRLGLLLAAAALIGTFGMSGRASERAPKTGHRAVTLPVHGHQLAYVATGDSVDLLMTFEIKDAKGSPEDVSATIIQNVPVLGVDKSVGLVVLQLDPTEAQYAVLAMQKDRDIWLAKREPGDSVTKPMEVAAFRKLFK